MGLQTVRSHHYCPHMNRLLLQCLTLGSLPLPVLSIRIVKGQDTACWQHEYFNRGCPQLISKIFRTRVKVKRRRATEAAGEPPPEAETPMQTHSDDSLEGASDYNENDGVHCSDANARGRYVASQISDTSSYFAPEVYEDEFDEKVNSMFSERSQSQNRSIGFANLDQMRLEPLPMDSVGILDSPCNCNRSMGMGNLDEFGQLLGHLI